MTGRATLMNLISQTDFYSIGIHDFDKQLSDFRAVSVPIPGCEVKLEFGYVTLADVPIVRDRGRVFEGSKRAA